MNHSSISVRAVLIALPPPFPAWWMTARVSVPWSIRCLATRQAPAEPVRSRQRPRQTALNSAACHAVAPGDPCGPKRSRVLGATFHDLCPYLGKHFDGKCLCRARLSLGPDLHSPLLVHLADRCHSPLSLQKIRSDVGRKSMGSMVFQCKAPVN